ncbi:MAG TPA: transporter substrate-binding domain-containing protein [Geobacteraceae bacterium]
MKKTLSCTVLVLLFALVTAGVASAGAILDGIMKRGELVVGISGDQPPLNATSKEGGIIGYDADLAGALAANLKVKVRFARMPFAELLPALQAGKVDMVISNMTMTTERNARVAFIGPYYVSGKGILLKMKNVEMLKREGINSEKCKVTTLKGSTSQEIISLSAPKAQLMPADSYDEALKMLNRDKADVLVADYPYCAYVSFRYPEKELVVGDSKLSFEPLGIAVREDALLINTVDNFLKLMTISGNLNTLQDKWFKSGSWVSQLP